MDAAQERARAEREAYDNEIVELAPIDPDETDKLGKRWSFYVCSDSGHDRGKVIIRREGQPRKIKRRDFDAATAEQAALKAEYERDRQAEREHAEKWSPQICRPP